MHLDFIIAFECIEVGMPCRNTFVLLLLWSVTEDGFQYITSENLFDCFRILETKEIGSNF